jgi:hypothetical protein
MKIIIIWMIVAALATEACAKVVVRGKTVIKCGQGKVVVR